jgi:hypothetical protein
MPVFFVVRYKPYEVILKMAPKGLIFDEFDQWCEKIPLIGTNAEPLPHGDFKNRGSTYWSSETPELHEFELHESLYPHTLPGPCDPEKLVRIVAEVIKQLLPYVDKKPLHRLYIGDFAPTYTFSGNNNHHNSHRVEALEDLFWSRMDVSYFRRLVHKPWGRATSNYLKYQSRMQDCK